MKSVLLVGNSAEGVRAEVAEVDRPTAGPGELVVGMKACGLCGTDLEKMRGEYSASMPILGHEAVGVVYSVGDGVAGFQEGDPVFPHHHVPCYNCYYCKSGSETMCSMYRSSSLQPGGFSEYFRVPRLNVVKGGVLKLPKGLGFEVASLIEPLACCMRAVEKCQVKQGETVLVAGAGPVGMMHALLLRSMGTNVLVSDVSEARLEFAQKSGVEHVLDAAGSDVPDSVRSETDGRGADVAIIASGSQAAVLQGLHAVRRGGRVCLFGIPTKGSVLDYDISSLYNSEQEIITSYGAVETETKRALALIASRSNEFSRLITHRFSLGKFREAVEVATKGRAMKVVVVP